MCDASLNNTIPTKYVLLRNWLFKEKFERFKNLNDLKIVQIRLISVEFA